MARRTTTKKPHYLPRFYLAGFTTSGTDRGSLWVLDKTARRRWKSNVRDAATLRGLYSSSEGPYTDPEWFEQYFHVFESLFAPVLTRIRNARALEDTETKAMVVNFVAMLLKRIPKFFDDVAEASLRRAETVLDQLANSTDLWNAAHEALRQQGRPVPNITHEQMKTFLESRQYRLTMPRNRLLEYSMKYHDYVLDLLCLRKWRLVACPSQGPHFVCSDVPVALNWTCQKPKGDVPGLKTPDTQLTLPLGRELALVGTFGEPGCRVRPTGKLVALVNGNTTTGRFVFSPSASFVFAREDGSIGHADELLQEQGNAP